VVAMGRNQEVLREVVAAAPPGRAVSVVISGDMETDRAAVVSAAGRPVDVFFDISPPVARDSSHIKAGVLALRPGGRMSLMGGIVGDVGFPYYEIMTRGLKLQGTYMYTPKQVKELIRMVETGVLLIKGGVRGCTGKFKLEEWEE